MRVERLSLTGDAAALAAGLRGLVSGGEDIAGRVAEIVAEVCAEGDAGGDAAVERWRTKEDALGKTPKPLRVATTDLEEALAALDSDVRAALKLAADNVRAVAEAGVDAEHEVTLSQGQRVALREVPVARAAVYVPGGRAPYPSTVVMGVVTARAAGVRDIVVCTPPTLNGDARPVILAACALVGVTEVYRMGGAHGIAALAYGTDTVGRVDVIIGPGSLYVQEAKRQVAGAGLVGIDGFAGPSDLLVILSEGADVRVAALDLRAQAEHGADSLVVAVSSDAASLDALAEALADAPEQGVCALVQTDDLDGALAFAQDFAPEHLELIGAEAEALAPRVTRAGCLFVGAGSATAFGDYVAGSNHILPTDGAARFASGLSTRTFRRRMAEVRIPPEAAAKLAPAGAALARAEGFTTHAESMEARIGQNGGS